MRNLAKQFQTISHQNQLWGEKSKIVLGISGGADSTCLLAIFYQLKETYDLELIIAHVNYGLRGKESEADEAFVRQLAKKYALPIEILTAEVTSTENLESHLRDLRYAFFEKIRQNSNFDLIAVAHNLDDQAETFLMRMLRGSGLKGLGAMQFKNEKLIRPLLATSRNEILTYLKENDLDYRTDQTNFTLDFYRNKIRHELLPLLEKNYNPNIKKTLFNATLSISEDEAFLEKITAKYLPTTNNLSAQKINDLHPAMQKRVLRSFIAQKKLNKRNIHSAHIEEILKIVRSTKGKNQTILIEGLKIIKKGDTVTISKI
ncbi:MAG: tRNA lysidine(34) synthetase TilS [Parcubacteria group bacterium]|jgi:tRNA(Ile)-lysidine synthase